MIYLLLPMIIKDNKKKKKRKSLEKKSKKNKIKEMHHLDID